MSMTLPVIRQVSIVLYSFFIPRSSGFICIAPSNSLGSNWAIGTVLQHAHEYIFPQGKGTTQTEVSAKKISTDGEGSQ